MVDVFLQSLLDFVNQPGTLNSLLLEVLELLAEDTLLLLQARLGGLLLLVSRCLQSFDPGLLEIVLELLALGETAEALMCPLEIAVVLDLIDSLLNFLDITGEVVGYFRFIFCVL